MNVIADLLPLHGPCFHAYALHALWCEFDRSKRHFGLRIGCWPGSFWLRWSRSDGQRLHARGPSATMRRHATAIEIECDSTRDRREPYQRGSNNVLIHRSTAP